MPKPKKTTAKNNAIAPADNASPQKDNSSAVADSKESVVSAILRPALSLFLISLVVAGILALVYNITKEPIAQALAREANRARQSVLPAAVSFETKMAPGGETYDVAYDAAGSVIGYAAQTKAKGYGGDILVMVGLDPDGAVLAVQVIACSDETPGLGQNVKKESFLDQFAGQRGPFALKKAGGRIDGVTSATYSSAGTAAAVNEALRILDSVRTKGGLPS
ncbi:MAG: RnfABCDGE type electron transport complex subunit G [Oscillospiraceae bacterium]|jgi:electron transport complex protein RnfG|nr:RnfABCDGE type electron transport complex subunit G [Oscillospiraceae bacterium]